MSDELKQYLRGTSWPIVAAMIALMVLGVLAIRVSEASEAAPQGYAARQVWFALVGLAVFLAATLVPYPRVGRLAYPLFFLTLILLVIVLVPTSLTMPRKGAHRWIGVRELSIQPSELAKLSFILLLAWYLRSTDHYRRLAGLLLPFALALVPMALILREPDLGTSLLFLPTLFLMLFMAGAKLRHLLGIAGIAALLIFLPVWKSIPPVAGGADPNSYFAASLAPGSVAPESGGDEPNGSSTAPVVRGPVPPNAGGAELEDRKALSYWHDDRRMVLALPLAYIEPHQLSRIAGWLRQDDPRVRMGKGYQLHQSIVTLGAGGLWGRKGWYEADTFFHMLPEDHTDFIFSVVGGQWGFAGCAATLFLYAVIFLFGVEIATATYEPFGRLLAIGVLAMLFSQLVINVGMTMGLMPITGMTLPLVSYGGSSLLVNCAALGLLVNVGQRRPILLGRRPFEFGRRPDKPPAPFGPLAEN